jgi:hypothetical protein
MMGNEQPLLRRLLVYASSASRDTETAPRLCAESHTLIETLVAALREVEWAGNSSAPSLSGRCPQCCQMAADGHLPACVVSRALVAADLAGADA